MNLWKKLIETFNHPTVRRKYPLINVLNVEIHKLDDSEQIKEIVELKRFIIDNSPFPPEIFKKPYFKSQTGINLHFPNIFSFHPDKTVLTLIINDLIDDLFPDGIPDIIDRRNYVTYLLAEIDNVVKETGDVKSFQNVLSMFENNKIKSLTQKVKTDLQNGELNPNDLIDDLINVLEPLLDGETTEKELLRLLYGVLLKLRNNEELDMTVITPIIYKFQNLLTFDFN